MKLLAALVDLWISSVVGSQECPGDLNTCIDMCPADVFKPCLQSCQKRCAPNDVGNVLRQAIGGSSAHGEFTVLEPNPEYLIWDEEGRLGGGFRTGWLKVPVHHDKHISQYVMPPQLCLRVIVKPARIQPARLGPILLHCGGPGSDAICALGQGPFFLDLNSTALVGPPVSDDYDYWSISQRSTNQWEVLSPTQTCPFKDASGDSLAIWPHADCGNNIENLVEERGVEAVLGLMDDEANVATWESIVQPIFAGPPPDLFGMPFYNETFVRWYYRMSQLELSLCYHNERYSIRSATNRTYNLLDHVGTENLAYDIEIFRKAIGASKMSIWGVSYGTMVASVYATVFPDKVHRLIIDGDMGSDPDVASYANWIGESVEATWTGLAQACDLSVMGGSSDGAGCPAAPGVTGKLHDILRPSTLEAQRKAVVAFSAVNDGLEMPGQPCSREIMSCISDLHSGKTWNESSCFFHEGWPEHNCVTDDVARTSEPTWPAFMVDGPFGAVLGSDYAGRFTEQTFVEWWRKKKVEQPLGVVHAVQLGLTSAFAWPTVPRPHPPVGHATLAPLIIGNLHDAQTPYHNAQKMRSAFPSGRLLTWQGYGHGLQPAGDVAAIVEQYEEETLRGAPPTYSNDVAKLLCVRIALQYLKDGTLPRDFVCKAASLPITGASKGSEAVV